MRREDIVAKYEAELDAHPEKVLHILLNLELALRNFEMLERSEFQPYATCPLCRLIYSAVSFGCLNQSIEGLVRRDEYELAELRECRHCGGTVAHVHEVFKPRPVQGPRIVRVTDNKTPCLACKDWVEPGHVMAVVKAKDGEVKLGSLCPECEGAK